MQIAINKQEQPAGILHTGVMKAKDIQSIVTTHYTKDVNYYIAKQAVEVDAKINNKNALFLEPIILTLPEGSFELNDQLLTLNERQTSNPVQILYGAAVVQELARQQPDTQLSVIFLLNPTYSQRLGMIYESNSETKKMGGSLMTEYIESGQTVQKKDTSLVAKIVNRLAFNDELTLFSFQHSLISVASLADLERTLYPMMYEDPSQDMSPILGKWVKSGIPETARIIANAFNAAHKVWGYELDGVPVTHTVDSIIEILNALTHILPIGSERKTLTVDFFQNMFQQVETKYPECLGSGMDVCVDMMARSNGFTLEPIITSRVPGSGKSIL